MHEIVHTLGAIEDGMRAGLHVGAQICAIIDGEIIVDAALGVARLPEPTKPPHSPPVPLTPETLMLWLSAGKPITAAAILLLWERGLIGLDEPVARYIPEFAAQGKQEITLRHLLTHTAGIRHPDPAFPHATWAETLAAIYDMNMERHWVPGLRAGYNAHTSWYLLGEVIERVTGTRHDTWIRDNILLPAGMTDTWLSLDPQHYHHYGTRLGYLYNTKGDPVHMPHADSELAAARSRPSASCRGPAHDLARFYEMLRRGGEIAGTRILQPQTVTAMTMRQRLGMYDQTFQHVIDWGLGLIINSAHHGPHVPYQFGPHASRETFGHGGSQSSVGFCDPQRHLAAAVIFNGRPGEPAHDKRLRAVLGALYEDLGLVHPNLA